MKLNVLPKLFSTLGFLLYLTACGSGDGDSRVIVSTADAIINNSSSQYEMPFVVQVADFVGAPQANTFVTLTVKLISFEKGTYSFIDTDSNIPPDGENDTWIKNPSLTCINEDTNGNGQLDAGEDINNNTTLDPVTPSIAKSSTLPTILDGTNTLITDENGFAYFSLIYPKRFATWVNVILTATAQDGFPENRGLNQFTLFGAQADVTTTELDAPAFVVSPYGPSTGAADCTNEL